LRISSKNADRRIRDLGSRDGFAVLNLAAPLERYAEEPHAYLHGFANTTPGGGHWNSLGHRVAGKLIARRLCDLIESH